MRKLIIGATTYYPDTPAGEQRMLQFTEQVAVSWRLGLEYDGEVECIAVDDDSPLDWKPGQAVDQVFRLSRGGVGQSLNALFRMAAEDDAILLYAVDDWFLHYPYELTKWAKILDDRAIVQLRLGPPHPNLAGKIRHLGGPFVIELDRYGQYGFVASHRPTLFNPREWVDAYGEWAEGVNAYDCERMMNERVHEKPWDGKLHLLAIEHPWVHMDSIELGDVTP